MPATSTKSINTIRACTLVDALATYLTDDMANKTSMLAVGHHDAITWATIYQTLRVRRNATHAEAVIDVTNAIKEIFA